MEKEGDTHREHLSLLRSGRRAWNAWRKQNPEIWPNLSGSGLHSQVLRAVDLSGADLRGADMRYADLRGADLRRAHLSGADFRWADLRKAKLCFADLEGALFVETNLAGANLSGSTIYGISAWKLNLYETKQNDLVITGHLEPKVTVDNLEVAQFIYLMLNNEKVRDVIDTIGRKAVLILGRFTPERKPLLDALRDELRNHDLLPVLFDFSIPASRD